VEGGWRVGGVCAGEREEQRRSRGGAAGESAAFNLGEIQESDLHNDVTFAKTDLWYVHRAGGRCREDITISRIMGFDSQQRAEEERRRSRGGHVHVTCTCNMYMSSSAPPLLLLCSSSAPPLLLPCSSSAPPLLPLSSSSAPPRWHGLCSHAIQIRQRRKTQNGLEILKISKNVRPRVRMQIAFCVPSAPKLDHETQLARPVGDFEFYHNSNSLLSGELGIWSSLESKDRAITPPPPPPPTPGGRTGFWAGFLVSVCSYAKAHIQRIVFVKVCETGVPWQGIARGAIARAPGMAGSGQGP
jgi:hypothetical protein